MYLPSAVEAATQSAACGIDCNGGLVGAENGNVNVCKTGVVRGTYRHDAIYSSYRAAAMISDRAMGQRAYGLPKRPWSHS